VSQPPEQNAPSGLPPDRLPDPQPVVYSDPSIDPIEESVEEQARGRDFINQGSRFMLLDNASRVMEPLLVLMCAKVYAGGEWGFFKYYEAVLILLLRLAVAGMDRGVVWIYSRRADDESFVRVFSRAVNFVFLFAVILALAAAAQWAGWLPSWTHFVQRSDGAPGFKIACYLLALPFQAATLLFYQALINKRSLLPIILIRNLIVPATALLPALLLSFTPFKPAGLAVPYLAGSLVGFFLSVWFFFRAYPLKRRNWAWRVWVPKDMIRFSLPLASTDVFLSFAYRADILLLGRYGGLAAVEVYAVIIMIANSLRALRQSFDSILLSVFSRVTGDRFSAGQRRNFSYAWWLVLTFQFPCLPFAMLFGDAFLGMISPLYAHGQPVLVLVISFLLINSLSTFYSLLVTAAGRTGVILVSQLAYLAASLTLNTLLVPRMGMMGAALAMGISGLFLGGICLGFLLRRDRSLILTRDFMVPAFASMLWFLPSIALYFFEVHSMTVRIPVFVAGAAGYVWQAYVRWKRFNAASG
jgi:O-antigen/teichoic acid export membrane protein